MILKFLATLPTDWAASPPSSELRQLLRLFNFFGHVTTAGFGSSLNFGISQSIGGPNPPESRQS